MRIWKAYLQFKFSAQRVTEVSFFEVTLSISRTVVSGFHNLRLARVVNQFPAQYFGKLLGFRLWKITRLSGVFLPFVGHFFKRAREREVELRHVVYGVWLVSMFSSRSKYGTFENE